MSSNSEFLHFKALINKFLNFFSFPILISSSLFFELTLSNIFICTNFSLSFICKFVSDFKIDGNKKKCKNSEFDDNPEITAYLQVKDTSNKSNDEVFVFNGWTFSSSPSLKPFDHPVYDIWLIKCY